MGSLSSSDPFLEEQEVDLGTPASQEPPSTKKIVRQSQDVDWDQSSPVSPVPASLLATLQLSQHLRPGLNLCTAPESVGNHISAKTFKSECSSKPFWSCWPPKWRRCWRRPWWWRRRWQRCESGSSRSPARQKVAVSSSRRLRRPELPFNEH